MHIDPKSTIVGFSSLKVRDFLRKEKETVWTLETVKHSFKLTSAKAKILIRELERFGLIESHKSIGSKEYWQVASKGRTLSLASAAKPLYHKTAQKKLEQFLERVRQANERKDFIYKITRVAVFGSFLTDRDRINDIDLAVEYVRKTKNYDRYLKEASERLGIALRGGRRFDNIVSQIFWPQKEIALFLKSGSRSISMHDFKELSMLNTPYKIVYQQGKVPSLGTEGDLKPKVVKTNNLDH
jgi:predicted nucleotidyltransferase